jgi:hypothetical protein
MRSKNNRPVTVLCQGIKNPLTGKLLVGLVYEDLELLSDYRQVDVLDPVNHYRRFVVRKQISVLEDTKHPELEAFRNAASQELKTIILKGRRLSNRPSTSSQVRRYVDIDERNSCGRCGGTGYIPVYAHVCNGVCFSCCGSGTRRYASSVVQGREESTETAYPELHDLFSSAEMGISDPEDRWMAMATESSS